MRPANVFLIMELSNSRAAIHLIKIKKESKKSVKRIDFFRQWIIINLL